MDGDSVEVGLTEVLRQSGDSGVLDYATSLSHGHHHPIQDSPPFLPCQMLFPCEIRVITMMRWNRLLAQVKMMPS